MFKRAVAVLGLTVLGSAAISPAAALEKCGTDSSPKTIACLNRNIAALENLLSNFVLVNAEMTAGKKCLYKAGVNTSDSVALEKCDSVMPNNDYMTWRAETPRRK